MYQLHAQVVEDAKAEVPVPDASKEGGENPSERRCTFMELALCLMPGLPAAAVNVLYKAASPSLQVRPIYNLPRLDTLASVLREHVATGPASQSSAGVDQYLHPLQRTKHNPCLLQVGYRTACYMPCLVYPFCHHHNRAQLTTEKQSISGFSQGLFGHH